MTNSGFHYQVAQVDMVELVNLPMFQQMQNSGTHPIMVEGRQVGTVDICHWRGRTSVSIQLVDTFLTIEQMMDLMNTLKEEYRLPVDQRISIEHR